MERKRLSDILNGDRETLNRAWDSTKAADDFGILPAGQYIAHVFGGDLNTSRRGTPCYKLTFKVIEGEYAGRRVWHECYLTASALPMAKRDLAKLGVTALEQLERPLPPGIRCRLMVSVRKDENGNEQNRVRSFEVLGIDTPTLDPFGPSGEGVTP
jgi:hypothetical protein